RRRPPALGDRRPFAPRCLGPPGLWRVGSEVPRRSRPGAPRPIPYGERGLPVRVIAWCSEKGGTAKTTSCVNVAFALAAAGRRVLVIDLDPQGNASLVLLGGEPPAPPTAGAVLLEEDTAASAVRPTATP